MRILHMSDVHFGLITSARTEDGGYTTESAHYFVAGDGTPNPRTLATILQRDLGDAPPDIIVCSGDAGWAGADADYTYAAEFFELLHRWCPTAPLVVAAGNHDVDSASDCADTDRQRAFIAMVRSLHGSAFAERYRYVDRGDGGLTIRQRLIDFVYLRDTALIVTVNSAAYMNDNTPEKRGTPVYIGPGELELINERIVALGVAPTALRIFVAHHHLFPFAEPAWGNVIDASRVPDRADADIVANSAKLQSWLADSGFELVLHGHKHLSHSRDDKLWRKRDSEGHRLLVIGAGSAGVAQNHRSEPLTYNVIDAARIGTSRWDVAVETREIVGDRAVPDVAPYYGYHDHVGLSAVHRPAVYCAERMDICHQTIARTTQNVGQLQSFVSVVESNEYVHPSTIRIGTTHPTQGDVERSFRALHPEWHSRSGWDDAGHVDHVLRDLAAPFQFQHGPRLFGILGRAGTQFRGVNNISALQPLRRAVASLDHSDTRAYVGLYNTEIDVTSDREPLPGLMSVQFVPDGRYLDVAATFRKLELSFWWVVNMYELGALLRWAARHDPKGREARRVTFFASCAEWKDNPEAAFVAKLDAVPLNDLARLVLQADAREDGALRQMGDLLRNKIAQTNDVNIDQTGLDRLAQLVDGVLRSRGAGATTEPPSPLTPTVGQALVVAAEQTRIALQDRNQRIRALDAAQDAVREALQALNEGDV